MESLRDSGVNRNPMPKAYCDPSLKNEYAWGQTGMLCAEGVNYKSTGRAS